MSALAVRALSVALSKVGQAETSGRPNEGEIVTWSIEEWTRREPGPWAKWCAGFVSSCFLRAEQQDPEPPPRGWRWHEIGSTSCHTLLGRCEAHGFQVLRGDGLGKAEPGDLIFFCPDGQPEAGPQHVGLVEKLEGSSLRTIEGNAGDAVRRRSYHLSFGKLLCLARCPW